MGRPPTRAKDLRDGWYIEVRNKGSKSGINIRRDTEAEMMMAAENYEKSKDVVVKGESKGGKWVNELLNKPKAKRTSRKKK